jgi:hypothetical protein
MGRAYRTHGRVYVGNPEGRRQLERQGRRWEDNIIMDLRQTLWGDMDRINLA